MRCNNDRRLVEQFDQLHNTRDCIANSDLFLHFAQNLFRRLVGFSIHCTAVFEMRRLASSGWINRQRSESQSDEELAGAELPEFRPPPSSEAVAKAKDLYMSRFEAFQAIKAKRVALEKRERELFLSSSSLDVTSAQCGPISSELFQKLYPWVTPDLCTFCTQSSSSCPFHGTPVRQPTLPASFSSQEFQFHMHTQTRKTDLASFSSTSASREEPKQEPREEIDLVRIPNFEGNRRKPRREKRRKRRVINFT